MYNLQLVTLTFFAITDFSFLFWIYTVISVSLSNFFLLHTFTRLSTNVFCDRIFFSFSPLAVYISLSMIHNSVHHYVDTSSYGQFLIYPQLTTTVAYTIFYYA